MAHVTSSRRTGFLASHAIRFGLMAAALSASLCLLGGVGQPDAKSDGLPKARAKFQFRMDKVDVALKTDLDAKLKAAKPKDAAEVRRQHDELQEKGIWPELIARPELTKEAREAREAINDQYQKAAQKLSVAQQDDAVKALNWELEALQSENWLTPWRSLADLFRADRAIEQWKHDDKALRNEKRSEPTALALGESGCDKYQIELSLTRKEGDGECSLLLPYAGRIAELVIDPAGKVSCVRTNKEATAAPASVQPLLPADQTVLLIATVRDGQITLESKDARVVDWRGPADELVSPKPEGKSEGKPDGKNRELRLLAPSNTVFAINSVRVRPILSGKERIPEIKKPEEKPKERKVKQPAAQEELFPLNRVWKGEWSGRAGNKATVKVVERNGNRAVLNVTREAGGHFRVDGTVNGDTFTVNDVEDHSPGGHNRVIRHVEHTAVRVNADSISVHLKFNWDNGGTANQPFENTVTASQ